MCLDGTRRAGLVRYQVQNSKPIRADRRTFEDVRGAPGLAKYVNHAEGECPSVLFGDFDGLSKKRDLKMNLDVGIPQDGSVAGLYIQFITKGAPHPNAAKLLIETKYSDAGQLAYANGFVHPIRTTVKIPDDLKKQFPPDDA